MPLGPAPFASGHSKVRTQSQPAGRAGGAEREASGRHRDLDPATTSPKTPARQSQCHRTPRPNCRYLLTPGRGHSDPNGSRPLTLPGLRGARSPGLPAEAAAQLPPPSPPRPPSLPWLLATGRERGRTAGHHGIKEDSTLRPAAPEVTGAEEEERRKRRKTPGRAAFRRRRARSTSGVRSGRVGLPKPEQVSEEPTSKRD